jgi:hypothetical protein
MFNAEELYAMKLGDEIQRGWYITRVPGGWIFAQGNGEATVFVPYNNEFEPPAKVNF